MLPGQVLPQSLELLLLFFVPLGPLLCQRGSVAVLLLLPHPLHLLKLVALQFADLCRGDGAEKDAGVMMTV